MHNFTQMSSKFKIHTPNHQFTITTIPNPVKARYREGKSTPYRKKTSNLITCCLAGSIF